MRSIAGRVVLLAVTISLILAWYAHRGQTVLAQQHTPLAVTRLYTGADALSHVEQVNVKFSPVEGAPPTVEQSNSVKVSSSYLVRVAAGAFGKWKTIVCRWHDPGGVQVDGKHSHLERRHYGQLPAYA